MRTGHGSPLAHASRARRATPHQSRSHCHVTPWHRSQLPDGRYGDAVWYPPDPDEPTSTLYRLIPARQRPGELREALDAASGTGRPDDDPIAVISPHMPRWRQLAARARPTSRRALGWACGLATLTLAGVLSLAIYAALSGH
jgi:hypothetical protein